MIDDVSSKSESRSKPSLFDWPGAERGMTLIEIILVVALLAIISGLAVTRLDTLAEWQYESELRRLSNLIQSLQQEANNRSESYRLQINLDANTYTVRREVPLDRGEVRDVDYLENLRTKGEKERRRKKKEEEEQSEKSLAEEFQKDDIRQTGAMPPLYYQHIFRDPGADVRLSPPLQAPSLGEDHNLAGGMRIRDVETGSERIEQGSTYLRIAPLEQFIPAVVHIVAGEQIYSVYVTPANGRVKIEAGDIEFRKIFGDPREYKNVPIAE